LEAFTKPGRLLVIFSMIIGLLGVTYVALTNDFFAPGAYPMIILLLPGFGGALALFCVGCGVFRLLGVTVWKTTIDDRGARGEEMSPKDGESDAPVDEQDA